jgi:hypothetical protein
MGFCCIFIQILQYNKYAQTSTLNVMFILLCELFIASNMMFMEFFIMYSKGKILIRWNNHEFGVQ